MKDAERYQSAKKHVRELKEFWIHLAVFVVVNAGLTTLNLVQTPDKLWFYWVLLGWGAGILLHASQAFGGDIAKNWEERKIQEIVKGDEEKEAARSKPSST